MTPASSVSTFQRRMAQAALIAFSFHAQSWASDIANLPLPTSAAGTARSNLMLIFDNSGSMGRNYLPDDAGFDSSKYGFFASQCNGLAYNPSITYTLPVDATGANFSAGAFTVPSPSSLANIRNITSAAPSVGTGNFTLTLGSGNSGSYATGDVVTVFSNTTATNLLVGKVTGWNSSTKVLQVNITSAQGSGTLSSPRVGDGDNRAYYFNYTGTQPKLGYTYDTNGVITSSTFYSQCNSVVGSTPGSSVFNAVYVTAAMSDFQNYANWATYYRTRVQMARNSIGLVMKDLDATRFRVGFNTISTDNGSSSNFNTTYTKTTNIFLPIGEFDQGTQKADFYSYLYGVGTGSSTPLRPALEKIGKYYAGRRMNGTALDSALTTASSADPLQYSCQKNFTILTTDGYWNTGDEPGGSGYVPTRLNGTTAIGNRDNTGNTYYDGTAVARPRLDDGRQQGSNWTTGGSGVSNSLADIAEYFFDTDLRNPSDANTRCVGSVAGQNVCDNNVAFEFPPPNLPVERVQNQRMTTYTVGLGLAGLLSYRSDYDTATTGDFYSIKQGTKPWPNPQTSGANVDSNTVVERVDDLWHTAVNGRGRYYSAGNPADLVSQLSDALSTITAATGTSAAAATSSQLPVSGDNYAFLGQYTTMLWEGNLKAFTIDTTTGAISGTALWEAKTTLKSQVASTTDSRTVYFRNAAVVGTKLSTFTYTNLNTAGLGSNFTNACSKSPAPAQCPTLLAAGASVQAAANDGTNLVNFLRGQTANEDIVANATTSRLYRSRPNTPLGDIINASPVYVKKPAFRYTDTGYSTFQSINAARTAVAYVAANDGMLHAFRASDGVELWAYVPTAVMPNLYRLADANYDTSHRYFVDATPVVGDVFDGTNWRTILVGGLGAGGRGYYALDVTDPANPISLWEFSSADDNDLGFTFGNPVITKNKAGTWVVMFTSGYNNVLPGNGNGHLFIRNAVTGAVLGGSLASKISTFTTGTTPAGTTSTPSELGKINPWIDAETNNTATRVYAGDMLGYMWRFDFDDNIAPTGAESMLLGRALTSGGVAQPITTKPVPFKIGSVSTLPAVAFATGRYLGVSDVGDTTRQSLYVIKETLGTTGLGTVRTNAAIVAQSMSATRVVTATAVDWSTKNGWYIDFAGTPAGERVNVDMLQSNKLLIVPSNQPSPSACNPGGNSVLYSFDLTSGALTNTALTYTTLIAGVNLIKLDGVLKVIIWDTTGNPTVVTPTLPTGSGVAVRRTSWRELIN